MQPNQQNMKENKSRYIFYFIVSIIIVLFRISCTTNLDEYGLIHRPVSYGLIVSGIQTFTDGFIGSMLCLLLLAVNLLWILYYMRKQGMTDKTKLNFIFLTFGLSLLVFEETIIRLLGVLIVFNSVVKFTKGNKE